VFNVLERNPTLKVIFAHFFFMSAQQARLADLLERYPNMHIDLTPGIEMYHNFSKNITDTRDFFIKYQDRILFGTDIGAKALLVSPDKGIEQGESHERVYLVRNFLENDGEFYLKPGDGFLFGDSAVSFLGLGLPEGVLEKIYYKNFERIVGARPRPLNPAVIVEMCNRIEMMIQMQDGSQADVPVDSSVVQSVRSHFEALP
jgi:predicted TIM-barrel fold metal-dependent hydrolase